jgi:hypothetical protein
LPCSTTTDHNQHIFLSNMLLPWPALCAFRSGTPPLALMATSHVRRWRLARRSARCSTLLTRASQTRWVGRAAVVMLRSDLCCPCAASPAACWRLHLLVAQHMLAWLLQKCAV